MKNLRRKKNASKVFYNSYKRALYKQFGRTLGCTIYKNFKESFDELYLNPTIYSNAALNLHLTKNILPGIAVYDAIIQSGLSKNNTLDAIGCFYTILYKKTKIAYSIIGRIPFFFQLLRKVSAWNMSITYPSEGWTTTWIENSNKKIAFDVSKCFYQDVLNKYKHAELLSCFCQIDDYVYTKISPKVEWKRTTTLGRCGSICDFRFVTKETAHEKK